MCALGYTSKEQFSKFDENTCSACETRPAYAKVTTVGQIALNTNGVLIHCSRKELVLEEGRRRSLQSTPANYLISIFRAGQSIWVVFFVISKKLNFIRSVWIFYATYFEPASMHCSRAVLTEPHILSVAPQISRISVLADTLTYVRVLVYEHL